MHIFNGKLLVNSFFNEIYLFSIADEDVCKIGSIK